MMSRKDAGVDAADAAGTAVAAAGADVADVVAAADVVQSED